MQMQSIIVNISHVFLLMHVKLFSCYGWNSHNDIHTCYVG